MIAAPTGIAGHGAHSGRQEASIGDIGSLNGKGGKCIVARRELDDNDAGPARPIGVFRWLITPQCLTST